MSMTNEEMLAVILRELEELPGAADGSVVVSQSLYARLCWAVEAFGAPPEIQEILRNARLAAMPPVDGTP